MPDGASLLLVGMSIWSQIDENTERGAELLVKEYGTRLYATAFRLCQNGHDAEDLVFRTFARVIEKIRTYNAKSSFFSWMCAILTNFYRMDARRKAANALVFNPEPPDRVDEGPNPFETLTADDEASVIRAAVDALPDDLRTAIVLHYFDGMSVPEIVNALEEAEGTVYWRLHEGRKRIREIVTKVFRGNRI